MASKFLPAATLGLGVALAACGGSAAPASSAAPPSSAAPSAAAPKPVASAAAPASGSAAPSKPAATSGATSASAKPVVSAAASGKVTVLGISQLFPHPVLDAYRKGFTDELNAQGFVDGKTLKVDFQNSQGDINATKTIADKFVSDKDDLIFCITTPSCLAASKATTTIPVIFGYVTDPVAAGIVKDAQHPGGNVTGVTALNRVTDQLKLMKEIVPNVKNVGTVWNPGESNSRVLVASMKAEGAASGYNIVEATASTSGEVPTAAKSLIGKVD
ncbi:MAG: ABC transporter substrate-binding protein, partial [Chloroflexota bacterium]